MDIEVDLNYASFVATCDVVKLHGIDLLIINRILDMLEWKKIYILVAQKLITGKCLTDCSLEEISPPVMAPCNRHLTMDSAGHTVLRISICGRSSGNSYQ